MLKVDKIDTEISNILEDVIKTRRHIHQNPELGYEEVNTATLVAKKLRKMGLEVKEKVGGHGVVGLLRGAYPGKTLLLRADMDALPIHEETGLPFASKVDGVMHACGHDMHTAILLGVAKVLTELRDRICGNIKFMFQPAEECSPDGGAKYMIKDGVLENPKVDYAMALHMYPQLKVGRIGFIRGPASAQSDRFFIKIKGKAGHASAPHQGIDAVVAAAEVISNFQNIIARHINPKDSIVITVGKINGGNRYNVLAEEVKMEGTVRIMTPGYEDKIKDLMQQVGESVAKANGAKFEMKYVKGYPMMINDDKILKIVMENIEKHMGKEVPAIIPQDAGGEDFAFISQRVPSLYLKIGSSATDSSENYPLHNSRVIFDEDCIPISIKAMVIASFALLREGEIHDV